jgi:aryl-alcohol dehydrogenase-like predicted oxidoreductase
MRRWCQDHGLSLRHLAIQFCLSAPIEGLVLTGPANRTELEQVYADATTPVDPGLWRQFKSHFGIVEYVAADTP